MQKHCHRLTFLAVVLMKMTVFCAIDDQFLVFSTPGPDRYADGQSARDGEYYAVVCSPSGGSFAGFDSAGNLVDPQRDFLVCRLPLAKNGHCPRTTLAVPANSLSGNVQIVLMDTRRPVTETPSELPATYANDAGGYVVRGWSVTAGGSAASVANGAAIVGTGATTAVSTERPDASGIPQPRITGFEVRDGYVTLRVADTAPGVYYTVQQAGRISSGFRPPVLDAFAQAGVSEGEIVIRAPVIEGSAAFFKIGAPEWGN